MPSQSQFQPMRHAGYFPASLSVQVVGLQVADADSA